MYSTLGWWEEHSVLNWIMTSWHHDMFDIKHYHCLTILLDMFKKQKKTTILPWYWYFLNEKKQHLKENSMDFTMFHRGSTSGSLRQCLGKSARDQFFHSGRAAVQRRRFKHRKWDMFHHENGWKWMKQLKIWWGHIFRYAIFCFVGIWFKKMVVKLQNWKITIFAM